jgi:hypothetical protein
VHWSGLVLPLRLDPKDKHGWLSEALSARTKYVRVLRREVNGRDRWFCQLVQEGEAPRLHETAEGVVGLDIGPSTIAVVSTEDAALEGFCPSVIERWKDNRRILRAMDRSRRATKPGNFDAKSISFAPNAVQTPKALESRTPPLAKGILLDRLNARRLVLEADEKPNRGWVALNRSDRSLFGIGLPLAFAPSIAGMERARCRSRLSRIRSNRRSDSPRLALQTLRVASSLIASHAASAADVQSGNSATKEDVLARIRRASDFQCIAPDTSQARDRRRGSDYVCYPGYVLGSRP